MAMPAQAATYYVATLWGNDANAGTSPTAAVKTLNYALNTLASGGDTIIVSPEWGITECINLTKSFTVDSKVTIFGDCLNTNGFTNLQGYAVSPAIVWWNNYTAGLLSTPTSDHLLDMNGYSNIVLHSLWMGVNTLGNHAAVSATGNSRKLYVTNCTMISKFYYAISFAGTVDSGFYFFADSSRFISTANAYAAHFTFSGATTSDLDIQMATKNCLFLGVQSVAALNIQKTAGAGTLGNYRSTNDLFVGGVRLAGTSTNTLPMIFENSLWSKMQSSGIQHTGQVIMTRSVLNGITGYANNIHLGNSALKIKTNNYAVVFNYGYLGKIGLGLADWYSPLPVAPYIGMGSTNAVLTDMYGKVRPQPVTPGPLEVQYRFQKRGAN
jgi:hypothetical protein